MARGKAVSTGNDKAKRGGRRSKAESMTGAAEATVEMRTSDLGLGEPLQIPSVDFKGRLKTLQELNKSLKSVKSAISNSYKAAKEVSDEMLDALKLALSLETKSADKIARTLKLHGYVLDQTGSNIQITLHDALMGNAEQAAYKLGFARGIKGAGLDVRYPKDTPLNENYALGWRNGQNKIMKLPHGETLETAVQRLDGEDDVDLSQAPVARPDGEDFNDPMSEPMPTEAASAVH